MIRPMLVAAMLGAALDVPAADELRVSQLEQDVRDLQRQVQSLSRQIESPQAGVPAAADASRVREAVRVARESVAQPAWIDAAKWQRIQPGMGELDVLAILGPPTSMRMERDTRMLLYALEIGASGFLRGSISMRDRSVLSVQKPYLQ
jgi:outer membrane murein-binding lipoprotein Lpp